MNKKLLLILVPTLLSACSSLPSWMGGRTEEKPKLTGERIVALPVDNGAKPDAALASTPPTLPPVTKNIDNAASGNLGGNLAGGDFTHQTSAKIGDGVKFSHTLAPHPVVANGMVFAMDAAGNISAHDTSDINKIIWQSPAVADADGKDTIGGGLAVDSGILYATTGKGAVAALEEATGKMLWRKDFAATFRAAPRASGDKVIVVTMDSQTYALAAKTGEILWDHRGINETASVMNSVSPTIVNDVALVPYASGELFAISMADGKELWSETLQKNKNTEAHGVFAGIGGDPVIDGSVIFATSNNGVTSAIHANGQKIWQQQVGSINNPWLAGDELFLLTTDNSLIDMVKYSGKIRWTTKLETYEDPEKKLHPISWRGAVLVNGKLLAIASNGKAVLVNATDGKIDSTIEIPKDIFTPPIIADGKLYLVGKNAELYSFE